MLDGLFCSKHKYKIVLWKENEIFSEKIQTFSIYIYLSQLYIFIVSALVLKIWNAL